VSQKLVVLAGPTGSGKTALALQIARRLNAEIVNSDSQQVYRYFDIGTAKPSPLELAEVPHHLISIIEPSELFSAAEFQKLADEAIARISSRGKRVLVVGGTGLYLRVLLHGLMPAPPADRDLRNRLQERAATEGKAALYRELAEVDPESAAEIEPGDLLRIIRALEIHQVSGVTASEYRRRHGFSQQRYPYELYVLSPPREALYGRIDERARAMFEGGLVEEVESLVQRGFRDAAPMRSVNYAQALAMVEGRMSRDEAIASAAQEARRYAKRQLTWFRREAGARFIAPPYAELSASDV